MRAIHTVFLAGGRATAPWMRHGSTALVATLAVAAALMASPAPVAAQSQEPEAHMADCVWPAVGGATAGVVVAWYGFVGLYALGGGSAFEMKPTPGNVALIVGLEWLGLVGGAMASCAIWGDEGRAFPTAGSVISGALVGAGAGVGLAFGVIVAADIDSDTDNPVASALLILAGAAAGIIGGGYLGFALDRAVRGPPGGRGGLSIAPSASVGGAGLAVTLRY